MTNFLKINEIDNVEVALQETDQIPAGHKRALQAIKKGEAIIKYGNPIGVASTDIAEGEWVHTHNLKTGLGELLNYSYEPELKPLTKQKSATFMGYKRSNHKVGIRNEVWIIPTVGCVNNIAQIIEKKSQTLVKQSVEGIYAFTHP